MSDRAWTVAKWLIIAIAVICFSALGLVFLVFGFVLAVASAILDPLPRM